MAKRGLATGKRKADEEASKEPAKAKKENKELGNPLNPDVFTDDYIAKTKAYLDSSDPFSHFVIDKLCDPERLRLVRDEIITHIRATFKETDIYKLFQTGDLANLEKLDPESASLVPELMSLKESLYGPEFRGFMERVTGVTDLNMKMDCSCNVYAQGCHLLCHDDVIGTRRISWIIYLTDPDEDWAVSDGGALELFPLETPGVRGVPGVTPTRTILPTWNSMVAFVVQPGISFHSVQEVFTDDKPRLSISGWFHSEMPPEYAELATLNQLEAKGQGESLPFIPLGPPGRGPHDPTLPPPPLTEDMRHELERWINPSYLKPDTLASIASQFYQESSIQLHHFLNVDIAKKLQLACRAEDAKAGLGLGQPLPPSYAAGREEGAWEYEGPPHKQRYLRYIGEADPSPSASSVGPLLAAVRGGLFESGAFAAWLEAVCRVGVKAGRSQVRRFRPALDYSIAHFGAVTREARLDATLCFVDAGGKKAGIWEEGEVGGFESYIMAEGGGDPSKAEAAEVYRTNDQDDSGLLQVTPGFNQLNLVLRDPGVMKFVKYVSGAAPGSRWDVAAEYDILVADRESDEEEEEGAENGEAGEGEGEGEGKEEEEEEEGGEED